MAQLTNYYEVLGVSREASPTEIRNAYRSQAKELHPDHPGGSAERFSRLQEANAVLSDPERRRQHDESLDLAHAADQLAGLNFDFGGSEDELSERRRTRESSGPSLGERLKGRFARKERPSRESGRGSGRGSERRTRGGYDVSEPRWYEPHRFDPEPVTLKSGAVSFVGAFLGFLAAGQIGLWSEGAGVLEFLVLLNPFMFILYTLVGLVAGYLAFRAAGWAGLALVFVAALVVGGQGSSPQGFLQFTTVGIITLLVVIWLGNRRETARR